MELTATPTILNKKKQGPLRTFWLFTNRFQQNFLRTIIVNYFNRKVGLFALKTFFPSFFAPIWAKKSRTKLDIWWFGNKLEDVVMELTIIRCWLFLVMPKAVIVEKKIPMGDEILSKICNFWLEWDLTSRIRIRLSKNLNGFLSYFIEYYNRLVSGFFR